MSELLPERLKPLESIVRMPFEAAKILGKFAYGIAMLGHEEPADIASRQAERPEVTLMPCSGRTHAAAPHSSPHGQRHHRTAA